MDEDKDIKSAQADAERKARESEQRTGGSPDYPQEGAGGVFGGKRVERGPDPTPPADEANVVNENPTPGGRAPEPGNPNADAPHTPTPQPRNTIPPNPGSDRGGGVSA